MAGFAIEKLFLIKKNIAVKMRKINYNSMKCLLLLNGSSYFTYNNEY